MYSTFVPASLGIIGTSMRLRTKREKPLNSAALDLSIYRILSGRLSPILSIPVEILQELHRKMCMVAQ
jgi:hypothetical protein